MSEHLSISPRTPPMVVQFGGPRTGTTFQYQALCATMYLLHDEYPELVNCRFWWPKVKGATFSPLPGRVEVVKLHILPDNFVDLSRTTWLFTTASSSVQNTPLKPKYTQSVDDLHKRGYFLLHDFQHIFNLTQMELSFLLEYMRFWSILRQCCGVQMSADWRAQLQNDSKHVSHHENQTSFDYPACEIYNIEAVEKLLISSHVYRRYHRFSATLSTLSDRDDNLTGSYCARTNTLVRTLRAPFNVPYRIVEKKVAVARRASQHARAEPADAARRN